MEMMIWNVLLTTFIGLLSWNLREKSAELQRIQILLNRTREEIARDNVTQAEIDKIVAHIDSRFDKRLCTVQGITGIEEVNVDAMTGEVVSQEHEDAAREAEEAEEDLLYRNMQSDLVRQILRRLAALRVSKDPLVVNVRSSGFPSGV